MGVPEEFFKPKTRRTRLNARKITMTYVGGLTSNGVDQGIKNIILCIQSHNCKLIEPRIDFHLFGLSATEELELRKSFPDEFKNQSIVCEKRQPHRTLVPKLQEADVFLLPYPEGDFFNVRFPLKALEYAALARPIMVSDTPSHRNIFNEREVWFFNQRSCEDFLIILKKLIDNEETTSKKVELAYAKAENFTYRRRVEKIVEKFHN
jgi:glycosyltransferase involved in cell wall biosynthesis